MRRKKGFTLIEVLAALAIIIVLTLALVVTIRAQVDKANRQNLRALVESVNTQIVVAYDDPNRVASAFTSVTQLLSADILTNAQWNQLRDNVTYHPSGEPPYFTVNK